MKSKNRIIALIALAAIFFWCGMYTLYSQTENLCTSVSVRWKEEGITSSEILRQEEYAKEDNAQNQPEITIWQEESAREISDTEGRTANAFVVGVFGNPEDATSAGILYGSFPARTDTEGCAVSSNLAFSLWGSINVVGMQVDIGGTQYYVRGVFDEKESRLFKQIPANADTTLSNMQMRFPDGGSREEAERYLVNVGFEGGTILDLPLLHWFCKVILNLPLVLLVLGMVFQLIKRGVKLRRYPVLLASLLPLCLITMAGLIFSLGKIEMPQRLIPSMLSDFDFWQRLFEGYRSNLITWLSFAPTSRDMELWLSILPMPVLSLIVSWLVMTAAVRVKVQNFRWLVIYCTAYMTVLGIASAFASLRFYSPMYLVPCLWMCLKFMLPQHEKWLGADKLERRNMENEMVVTSGQKQEEAEKEKDIFLSAEKIIK